MPILKKALLNIIVEKRQVHSRSARAVRNMALAL